MIQKLPLILLSALSFAFVGLLLFGVVNSCNHTRCSLYQLLLNKQNLSITSFSFLTGGIYAHLMIKEIRLLSYRQFLLQLLPMILGWIILMWGVQLMGLSK